MTRHARRWTEKDLRHLDNRVAPGRLLSDRASAAMRRALEGQGSLVEQLRAGVSPLHLGTIDGHPVASPALDDVAVSQIAMDMDRQRKKAEREKLENAFRWQLESFGIMQEFQQQATFHSERKWRLDFYAAAFRLGAEIHGAVYAQGRHTRGSGFVEDRRKMNAAAELGITVLEYTPEDVTTGNAACQVLRILEQRGFRRVA